MKNIIILVLFTSSVVYAQRGGGMERGQQQNQNMQSRAREIKEFKASDIAGIFYYDVKTVIKKIKVKDKELKNKVSKTLKDYNFKIKEIAFLNSDNFKSLDILMKSNRGNTRNARQQNNSSQQPREADSLRIKVREIIRPIKRNVRKNEEVLNENLASILSEKQNKKWLKYQKSQKEKLAPQKPQNNNRTMQQRARTFQSAGRRF
ncbi:hypothetical protein [Polaribacter sp. M15]